MRKSLKVVPVFGPDQDQTKDQPIDQIARSLAGFLIADGRAIGLKGRAIRLLPNQRCGPLIARPGASSRPNDSVIRRYVTAKRAGTDHELVAAIDEFTSCPRRTLMLNVESEFRRRAKLAGTQKRAARLADKAIILQRKRFLHEEQCPTCQRIGEAG